MCSRATMAETLPWEIIEDILSRLPVKDLLRYRCVSKQWCSLVDDPDFINRHLNHSKVSNSNLVAGLVNGDFFWADVDALDTSVQLIPPIDGGFPCEILGSCNGLLVLTNWETDLIIWNPSTRRYRDLPIPNVSVSSELFLTKIVLCGFGHDPTNDDYKLVTTKERRYVDIYSAKGNAWKSIETDFPYDLETDIESQQYGVFVGSAVHWLARSEPEYYWFILAFDLVTEEFHGFLWPDYETEEDIYLLWGFWEGHSAWFVTIMKVINLISG